MEEVLTAYENCGRVERKETKMKKKQPMPRYYGKNIVQNAQKRFLKRKAQEADHEKRRDRPADAVENGKKD